MSLKGLVLSLMMMALIICGDPKLDRHIIPLYGNSSLGYYYANIFVGSPAQEQSVIIDTGSGQLALPCSKCESCGKQHIHQPFNILKSSSNKIITCVKCKLSRKQQLSLAMAALTVIQTIHADSQYPMQRAVLYLGF